MPHYQRRGGLDIGPPPYVCESIDARVFYVEADAAALRALCDRTLNTVPRARAGADRFEPASSIVAVTFQEFHELHSPDDPHHGGMRYSYREASFWVLVHSPANGPRVLIPYMFVDNWAALAAGREVVGFPKELAAFPGDWNGRPPVFDIQALAGPAGGTARQQQVVRVEPRDRLHFMEEVKELADLRKAAAVMQWVGQLLLEDTLGMVFLRQIRALAGGHSTDLQQVTAADARPFELTSFGNFYLDLEMQLADTDSHPIRRDFGFPAGAIPVPGGFRAQFRFRLQPGTEIP